MIENKETIEYLLYMKHDVQAKSPMDIAIDTAIEKFRQLSQDHLDRDRGEPEYHRGKAHAYSIAADMFEMWMEEENDG